MEKRNDNRLSEKRAGLLGRRSLRNGTWALLSVFVGMIVFLCGTLYFSYDRTERLIKEQDVAWQNHISMIERLNAQYLEWQPVLFSALLNEADYPSSPKVKNALGLLVKRSSGELADEGKRLEKAFRNIESAFGTTGVAKKQVAASAVSSFSQAMAKYQKEASALALHDISVRQSEMKAYARLIGIASFILTIALMIVALRFVSRVKTYFDTILRFVERMANGEQPKSMNAGNNEISRIMGVFNQVSANTAKAGEFAREIGKGNFDHSFTPVSDHDRLGNALVTMSQQLKQVAEQDKERRWINEGYTKFIEILRNSGEDMASMGDAILRDLVKYCDCNQGALYISEGSDNTTKLRMVACYAYGRKKYLNSTLLPGEGLVGQAYLEREPIFMTEVPDDYVNITSGLGTAPPTSIIIIPLLHNDEVKGILELASFHTLDGAARELLDKVCESVASMVSTVKVNEETQSLLEETQEQAESLRAQEEELRQNMEELQATHEQMERIKHESDENNMLLIRKAEENFNLVKRIIDGIPSKIYVKDGNLNMYIVNKKMLEVHGCEEDELIGKSDRDFFAHDPERAQQMIDDEMEIISSGKTQIVEHLDGVNGNETMVWGMKAPVFLSEELGTGILGYQIDITERTNLEEKVKELEALVAQLEGKA
ncbi:hypothetical protein FUAX_08270 [Fulvitalea axinellae]|uniref:PAS domain-containing protein n=1 Tax=Fulvitalea axinellae TaxID=1182444 RepID=A0AAU9DC42_9BACT|nr:hypothetical protein FUAX_08270 [Fulvitalea axinellae]